MPEPPLGVLGGSGLYDLPGLEGVERPAVDTPFGAPSDELVIGRLGGTRLVFLPRHGRGHRLLPTEINFRANIFALKRLGVEWIVAVSAVGSLREEIAPGHVVVPDQFIDRTRQRASTFFGRGVVAHVQFADPVCPSLSRSVTEAARRTLARVAAALPARTACPCPTALDNAIITERAAIPAALRRDLAPLLRRHL